MLFGVPPEEMPKVTTVLGAESLLLKVRKKKKDLRKVGIPQQLQMSLPTT